MARGRMLNKKISQDSKVAQLSLKSAFLYTWMISHADAKGRLYGNDTYLKGTIIPHVKDIRVQDIEPLLIEMANVGLICYYGEQIKYVELMGWKSNQFIQEEKEAKSEIPCPTFEQLGLYSGVTPELLRKNVKDKEKLSESKRQSICEKTANVGIPAPGEAKKPLTDIQKIVCAFKVKKGFDINDIGWDKINYSRNCRAAKQLLDYFGSWRDAVNCIDVVATDFDKKGLTWALETVCKWAADYKIKQEKQNASDR